MTSNLFKKLLSVVVSASIIFSSTAFAVQQPLITSDQLIVAESSTRDSNMAKVETYFSQAQVTTALEKMGVAREDALRRVSNLSDSELAKLAQDVDSAPAGGIIGEIIFIFLVLLVTDILGFTKIFPFTRSIR